MKKLPAHKRREFLSGVAVSCPVFLWAKQQGEAPEGRKAHNGIDNPGKPSAGTAADKSDQVKVEQADDAPV